MSRMDLEVLQEWSKLGHRNAFSEALLHLADENSEVVVVNADIATTARLTKFQKKYPERLMNVGIAEQNMIGFSAGLAKEGLRPFAVTLAAFAPMRCAEQMRMALGYMNLNAVVVGIEAGCRFGPLGNTHFAMDDISTVRAIPNFTIVCPSDPRMILEATMAASKHTGPVYMRLTGGPGFALMYEHEIPFELGKAIEYKPGRDVAIISTGSMLSTAVQAAETLEATGVSVRVIDMHTIKPLDTDMLADVVAHNPLIVTIEEHNVMGGLGSAVAEYVATQANAPKLVICGIPDQFRPVGDYGFQLQQAHLTAQDLVEKIQAE